ncbi:MAG: hypothetical protein ACLFQ4_01295 [Halanaerobium sp.]
MEAKIKTVCLSEEKGTTKKVKKGDLIGNFGLKGDAHAGKWHRQGIFAKVLKGGEIKAGDKIEILN